MARRLTRCWRINDSSLRIRFKHLDECWWWGFSATKNKASSKRSAPSRTSAISRPAWPSCSNACATCLGGALAVAASAAGGGGGAAAPCCIWNRLSGDRKWKKLLHLFRRGNQFRQRSVNQNQGFRIGRIYLGTTWILYFTLKNLFLTLITRFFIFIFLK